MECQGTRRGEVTWAEICKLGAGIARLQLVEKLGMFSFGEEKAKERFDGGV